MFQLISPSSSEARRSLESGELLIIGRGGQCDVRLDDPSASRVHCRLRTRNGKLFLTDAGSRWGTFVNGRPVTECELQPGDEITIGETLLRVEANVDAGGTTLARPSELLRPAGLTIRPDVGISLPTVLFSPESGPDAVRTEATAHVPPSSSLRAADYIKTGFQGCQVQELLRSTRRSLLFRATREGTDVALKLFHPAQLADEIARQRFLRAIEVARGLRHPHLVELLDGGIVDGIPYTISEFIAGV